MKKNQLLITILAGAMLLASCGNKASHPVLATQADTLSWAMGVSLAKTAQSGFFEFNQDLLVNAFESQMSGKEQPLSQEEIDLAYQYLAMLAAQQSRHIQEQQQKEAETNEPALFEKLKSEKPNLKQAPLGYYYEVLQEGKGHKATVGKRISIDFIASELATGKVFENTYNDHTIVHVLGKPMFEGILDGLQLMNAGSKYRFYFPSKLVKGASGVAPYTPLVYEVELHEIFED